jgi:hypothetical protein
MVAAAGQLPTAPLYTTRWDTTGNRLNIRLDCSQA